MYRYILFDLDGTLTDSSEGLVKSFAYALRKMGQPDLPRETLLRFIGPPLTESCREYCGMNEAQSSQVIAYFHERFDEIGIWENRPIDGAVDLLRTLKEKGYAVALASSKPRDACLQICERFGFSPYMDLIGGRDGYEGAMGKAEVMEGVIQKLGVQDRSQVLMVGDRKYDCIGAKACGVDCAGLAVCQYGEPGELEAYGAVTVAETVEELKDFIFSH